MHVVAQGGGGKRTPFCRRKADKAFHANTHNMQESQDNAVDSVGLMRESGYRVCRFLLYTWKGHLRKDALSMKIGSTVQDAAISSLSLRR